MRYAYVLCRMRRRLLPCFPFTFRFLAEYQLSVSIVNQINLSSYIGIFLMMIFVMGLVFELPVLAWVLSRMGIVNRALLVRGRRYAVVGLLVLSAIITPSRRPVHSCSGVCAAISAL